MRNQSANAAEAHATFRESHYQTASIQWAISNNGFRSDSLYEKKIGEDLVFNNALPKSLTITQVACLKAKPKLHNGAVWYIGNLL